MTDHALDFVVFSDDWGRHPSSCQHLFARLLRRHRVLWVNTIGLRAPRADAFTLRRGLEKLAEWRRPLRRISPSLHVYAPAMLPVAGGGAGRLNARLAAAAVRRVMRRLGFQRPVLFASVPTAADYLGRLGEAASVYYITDDYRSWPGANPEVIAAQDARLTAEADLVLPCGPALAEGRAPGWRMMMLPHAVDLDHFARPPDAAEPVDLAGIGHPRLCFFGLIYEKIDLDLLARLARARSDRQIVLLGPVATDLAAVAGLANVHVLGPRPYEQLPAYLHAMDVLLLAYRLDEQTRRNAPLKIRECLAVGKPVVAKGMADLAPYAGLIELADSDEAYLAACDRACRARPDVGAMRAAVAADTWEARARQVEAALADLDRPARPAAAGLRIGAGTDRAAWDAFVAAHPSGSVWHRWDWAPLMDDVYGLPAHLLTARRHGALAGVLPLALQSSRLFGRRLVSLPWLDHAGILAADDDARAALLDEAIALAERLDAELTIRQRADATADAAADHARSDKVAMVLDLPGDGETLWEDLQAKVRNQVRKARKAGLTADWAGGGDLDAFHRIYAENMRDLGSPPHAAALFAGVLERFADVARLLLVRCDGRPVAGALVLADAAEWQVPWASSLRSANALCPNVLMYWTLLEAACGRAARFCFGRSTRDSGTYRFKAQWGSHERPLLWQTWTARRTAPAAARDAEPGRLMTLAQRTWRRLPLPLARTLGPHIIRCVG
ncbi:MAG: FemAB family PEP-CTERM system-associated protein [Planctomycetes bacterium]|nr:FemAB family PEP-CTERM system-associated protein [Planctomycetota bacterium]